MKDRSQLFNELYGDLRQLARGRLAKEQPVNERGDATSLVHEVYLKLRTWSSEFQNDEHFLATAASAMRQVLVDRARARKTQKRGAPVEPLSVSMDGPLEGNPTAIDLLLFHEMLDRLTSFDARAAQILEMRVFLGLSVQEIADDLRVSTRTVKRDWSAATAWLKVQMGLDQRTPGASGS